ncbi:hypothetical protein ACFLZJ_01080 [Nanoarchaeota archaeon]
MVSAAFPWILIAVAVAIVILAILAIFMIRAGKGKRRGPDYYTFFIMGIIFLVFGLVSMENSFFFILGLVLVALGLLNRDKWKKNHRTWKDYNKKEKKLMVWVIVILVILLLAGIVVNLLL